VSNVKKVFTTESGGMIPNALFREGLLENGHEYGAIVYMEYTFHILAPAI